MTDILSLDVRIMSLRFFSISLVKSNELESSFEDNMFLDSLFGTDSWRSASKLPIYLLCYHSLYISGIATQRLFVLRKSI